jgi:hypothetical protein
LIERASLRALTRVADVPLAVGAGFALAVFLLLSVVSQVRFMPLGLARILAVQERLAAGIGPVGGVAVFGSSVVLEGVDCAALATRLRAETPCQNLAWTGGNPSQWLLVEPALRRSPPRVLVVGLDPFALLNPVPIPDDRLAIAGWWQFVPAEERGSLRSVLSEDELRSLEAPRLVHLLRFRSFPFDVLNERVREVARTDLRYDGYLANFTAPWLRHGTAAPAALERHLAQLSRVMQAGGTERLGESEPRLVRLVERARAASPETRFLFVLTPVHPHLQRAAGAPLAGIRAFLAALAARLDVRFVDHSLSLEAAEFSDAVHPSAAGRSRWSLQLGDSAAALSAE